MNGNAETNNIIDNLKGKIAKIPEIDKTLAKEGYAADAKKTGDELARVEARLYDVDPHFAKNMIYDNTASGLEAQTVQSAIDETLKNMYTPNLLINGDFQCNQRGKSSYTFLEYSCDMWCCSDIVGSFVGWTEKGIVFTEVWQKIAPLPDDNYVFSYRLNGETKQKTIALSSNNSTNNDGYLKVSLETDNNHTRVTISTVNHEQSNRLNYARLDRGLCAKSHIKEDYAIALARCKQYIQAYKRLIGNITYKFSDSSFSIVFTYEKMADTPIVTVGNTSYLNKSGAGTQGTIQSISYAERDSCIARTSIMSDMNIENAVELYDVLLTCEPPEVILEPVG